MGDKITLSVTPRDVHGKKVKSLRREGVVPAVVYGPGMEPVSVQIDNVIMGKVYAAAGKHSPIHLTLGTTKKIVLIKDVEVDNVRRRINHVSFHAVRQNKPVETEVPIRLIGEGESEAEKAGLIILQALDKVEVRALPMNLPDSIEVSIVELKEAGEKITLADAKMPEGVELVDHDDGHQEEGDEERPRITDLMVASVWEPAALQAANDAAAGDAEEEAGVEAENGAEGASEDGEEKTEDSTEDK